MAFIFLAFWCNSLGKNKPSCDPSWSHRVRGDVLIRRPSIDYLGKNNWFDFYMSQQQVQNIVAS